MSNRFSGNNVSTAAAEGRVGSLVGAMARDMVDSSSMSFFARFVVVEVIFDPTELDAQRLNDIEEKYGISGANLTNMPYNTVIAKRANDLTSAHERFHYLFPFFPQHMMLPVNAGEHVWAFFEQGKKIDNGFWMCRISEPRNVDDLNFTHADRKFQASNEAKDSADLFNGPENVVPGFENGPTALDANGNLVSSHVGTSYGTSSKSYEEILKQSDSAKVTDFEEVPRHRKRPGDFALQGSNNTLINLGTDRTGRTSEYVSEDGKHASGKPQRDQREKAGSIDIVAGRGQGDATKATVVANSLGRSETVKNVSNEKTTEGDPDFELDLSRVYVSMKTDVDGAFQVNFSSRVEPGPAVVIKTDHIRLIARDTMKLFVQPYADAPQDECAGVLVKDGNLVFIPAANGYCLLGGEDASMVPLCQPAASKAGGTITASPIISTLGSQVGMGAMNGAFATKCLIK